MSVSDRRGFPSPEDPSFDLVESLLSEATERTPGAVTSKGGRVKAGCAVWFCVCVTEHADAPTWLIFDTPEGDLGWLRDDGDRDIPELVDGQIVFGDHVHPGQVADWLRGRDPGTLFDIGGSDLVALRALGKRLKKLQHGA